MNNAILDIYHNNNMNNSLNSSRSNQEGMKNKKTSNANLYHPKLGDEDKFDSNVSQNVKVRNNRRLISNVNHNGDLNNMTMLQLSTANIHDIKSFTNYSNNYNKGIGNDMTPVEIDIGYDNDLYDNSKTLSTKSIIAPRAFAAIDIAMMQSNHNKELTEGELRYRLLPPVRGGKRIQPLPLVAAESKKKIMHN